MNAALATVPARTFTLRAIDATTFRVEHSQTSWQFIIERAEVVKSSLSPRTHYSISIESPVDGSRFRIAVGTVYHEWNTAARTTEIGKLIEKGLQHAEAVERASVWLDAQQFGLGKAERLRHKKAFNAAQIELSHGRLEGSQNTYGLTVNKVAAWIAVRDYNTGAWTERVYLVGDEAAYAGYNLTYTGEITKITASNVFVKSRTEKGARRLSAGQFASWNNRSVADIAASNAEASYYL